jgi:hypothetical protein
MGLTPEKQNLDLELQRFLKAHKLKLESLKASKHEDPRLNLLPESLLSFYAYFVALEDMFEIVFGDNPRQAVPLADLAKKGIVRRYRDNFHPDAEEQVKQRETAQEELRYLKSVIQGHYTRPEMQEKQEEYQRIEELLRHIATTIA